MQWLRELPLTPENGNGRAAEPERPMPLGDDLVACREGLQRIRHLPESGPVSTSDHQEHVKAVQQVLEECRTQLVAHERKFQDGERQVRRLQDEMKAQHQQPKPEAHVGLPADAQAAIESRFSQIEETLRKSQKQYSQWQGGSVKDAQAIETDLPNPSSYYGE